MTLTVLNCQKRGEKVIDFRNGQSFPDPLGAYLQSLLSGQIDVEQSDYLVSVAGFNQFAYDDPDPLPPPFSIGYEYSFFKRDGLTTFYHAPQLPMFGAHPLNFLQPNCTIINGFWINGYYDGILGNTAQTWPLQISPYNITATPNQYDMGIWYASIETDYNLPFETSSGYFSFFSWPLEPGNFGYVFRNDDLGYMNWNCLKIGDKSGYYKLFSDESQTADQSGSLLYSWLVGETVYNLVNYHANDDTYVWALYPVNPSDDYAQDGFSIVLSDATDNDNFNNFAGYFTLNNTQIFMDINYGDGPYSGSVLVFSPDMTTYFKYNYFVDDTTWHYRFFIDIAGDIWLAKQDFDNNYFAVLSTVGINKRWRIPLQCANYCLHFKRFGGKKIA